MVVGCELTITVLVGFRVFSVGFIHIHIHIQIHIHLSYIYIYIYSLYIYIYICIYKVLLQGLHFSE